MSGVRLRGDQPTSCASSNTRSMMKVMRSTQKTIAAALSGRGWDASLHHDLPALLDLAVDTSLTTDTLSVVAPGYQDRDADIELVNRVLDQPACVEGVASRYATRRAADVRLRAIRFPGIISSTPHVLAMDADERLHDAARALLESRPSLGGHGVQESRSHLWRPGPAGVIREGAPGGRRCRVRRRGRRLGCGRAGRAWRGRGRRGSSRWSRTDTARRQSRCWTALRPAS